MNKIQVQQTILEGLRRTHHDGMAIESLSDIAEIITDALGDQIKGTKSVLQDWVAALPLRAQGTLLTCVRGCDLTPKFPLDSPERQLVGMLRHAFLNPADPREVGVPGSFFIPGPPSESWLKHTKFSVFGHYPQHWVSHVMHSAEVLGMCHPNAYAAGQWLRVYLQFCKNFHVRPETKDDFLQRMTEDRIATDTVVS